MKGKVNIFRILSVLEGDIANHEKELSEIKDNRWVYRIYKENLDSLIGYFIQFNDGSYIVGNMNGSIFGYCFIISKNFEIFEYTFR
mgnify:CR=1 FL=1